MTPLPDTQKMLSKHQIGVLVVKATLSGAICRHQSLSFWRATYPAYLSPFPTPVFHTPVSSYLQKQCLTNMAFMSTLQIDYQPANKGCCQDSSVSLMWGWTRGDAGHTYSAAPSPGGSQVPISSCIRRPDERSGLDLVPSFRCSFDLFKGHSALDALLWSPLPGSIT